MFFNVFISDLIKKLNGCKSIFFRIGNVLYNCFVYTDDVSLFSWTIPDLQHLIICVDYASKLRFTFGIHKSECMSVSYNRDYFIWQLAWHLCDIDLKIVDKLDSVGVYFNSNVKLTDFVQSRIVKCKRVFSDYVIMI